MHEPPIRIYDLRDSRQYDHDQEYWQGRSQEERLSAVEELRRQYGMFSPGRDMTVAKDFEEFFASCNKHGVEYLVVGGYAFALHAHPRYTGDLDVFVESSESNARLIIKALSDFGFGLLSLTWKDFATTGRVIQLGFPPCALTS